MLQPELKKVIETLKKELGRDKLTLNGWNDYILHVCKDGQQRTVREIFNSIELMDTRPWLPNAKTPCTTCSSACGELFKQNKLCKTNDSPIKYFSLIK